LLSNVYRPRYLQEHQQGQARSLSVPDQVLGFLAANKDRAFKAHEIASQIGVDEGAVSTPLSQLKNRELVEHKATYWVVTDDAERLGGYSGYERATALFNDQLSEEDKESWRKHAPNEPHPSAQDEQWLTKPTFRCSSEATSSMVTTCSKAGKLLGRGSFSRI